MKMRKIIFVTIVILLNSLKCEIVSDINYFNKDMEYFPRNMGDEERMKGINFEDHLIDYKNKLMKILKIENWDTDYDQLLRRLYFSKVNLSRYDEIVQIYGDVINEIKTNPKLDWYFLFGSNIVVVGEVIHEQIEPDDHYNKIIKIKVDSIIRGEYYFNKVPEFLTQSNRWTQLQTGSKYLIGFDYFKNNLNSKSSITEININGAVTVATDAIFTQKQRGDYETDFLTGLPENSSTREYYLQSIKDKGLLFYKEKFYDVLEKLNKINNQKDFYNRSYNE